VLPSAIDIHAASRLIADLLLVAKVSRRMGRLGVVANRVRENTLGFRKLMASSTPADPDRRRPAGQPELRARGR